MIMIGFSYKIADLSAPIHINAAFDMVETSNKRLSKLNRSVTLALGVVK